MKRNIEIQLLCLSFMACFAFATANAEIQSIQLKFYSNDIQVDYNTDLIFGASIVPNKYNRLTGKSQIEEFYSKLEKRNYEALLTSLQNHREYLQLNDWLFYELIVVATQEIFKNYSKNHQTLVDWFFLAKSGFDARITYLDNTLFLNVYTKDQLFEVPIIREGNRSYANLSSIHSGGGEALGDGRLARSRGTIDCDHQTSLCNVRHRAESLP